jgi:hypothetical protein
VYIAPAAWHVPDGRMVDPETCRFWVSWQDDEADENVEDAEIDGAEAAIAWGRARSDEVLMRLGNTGETYFSAGDIHLTDDLGGGGDPYPLWPPPAPPAEGWWTSEDEAAATRAESVADSERLGVYEPEMRREPSAEQ